MTEKQHNIFFLTLLVVCVLLTLTLNPPTRNYIPVVWGLLGFGLHGFWFWNTWMNLSKKLITEHRSELRDLKVSFNDNQFKQTVDMFALFQDRKRIENISDDIKTRLSYYQTYFRLTLIAFPMFAVLGILTVVMTWK
jgi:hypothetical protein